MLICAGSRVQTAGQHARGPRVTFEAYRYLAMVGHVWTYENPQAHAQSRPKGYLTRPAVQCRCMCVCPTPCGDGYDVLCAVCCVLCAVCCVLCAVCCL